MGLAARTADHMALGLEPYERKYCHQHPHKLDAPKGLSEVVEHVSKALTDEECAALIEQRKQACAEFDLLDTNKQAFSGKDCKEYRRTIEDIKEKEKVKLHDDLGQASKACEAAMLEVCKATVGPTWCALGAARGSGCEPEEVCSAAGMHMWHAGSWDCRYEEGWKECVARKQAEWDSQGGITAMEALMREQTLKCVCVAKQADNGHCYGETRVALHPGEKWCEFDRTMQWTVLKERDSDSYAQLWKPECEEFPYRVSEEEEE